MAVITIGIINLDHFIQNRPKTLTSINLFVNVKHSYLPTVRCLEEPAVHCACSTACEYCLES